MAETLDELLRASAARFPEREAVVDGAAVLTYAELDAAATRVAHLVRAAGAECGDRVGVLVDKSAAAVAAVHGALRAGAAYVPLDPDAPAERLGYIARDCGLRCMLASPERAAAAPGANAVVLDGAALAAGDARPPPRGDGRGHGRGDLAYVLYTSGSTGAPKGVAHVHGSGLAFVEWAVDEFGVRPDDRLASHAPFHFDLSVFDLFAAAAAGAAVVLVPRETALFPYALARFAAERAVTVWYSVPSALVGMVTRGKLGQVDLSPLRLVLFAGEVFPTRYLRELAGLLPHARLVNLFGPTETNACTFYDVPPLPAGASEPIPIGRAIGGVEALVLAGGELGVKGPTVMQGYWGDPERTARALVPDPRGLPGLVYRTGDYVRELADGNLHFLGRRDAQVKSRGYRIELGEVEAALHAHEAVVECAVVAVPDEELSNTLEAFVTVDRPVTTAELRRFCRARLPHYMVPQAFRIAAALPRTSTGKLDRRRLVREAAA